MPRASRSNSGAHARPCSVAERTPYQEAQLARLERLLNPRSELLAFGPDVTRGELRGLPLKWIFVHSFDEPLLAFRDKHQGEAAVLRAELDNYWQIYRRKSDPKAKRMIALQARRAWARMVELAEGIRIRGARWHSVVLFAS